MTDPQAPDSIEEFTNGDAGAARSLRENLARLHDQTSGTEISEVLRQRIAAVLSGRLSMRDLAQEPELRALADDGMLRFQAAWHELSDEQRAEQMPVRPTVDDHR